MCHKMPRAIRNMESNIFRRNVAFFLYNFSKKLYNERRLWIENGEEDADTGKSGLYYSQTKEKWS